MVKKNAAAHAHELRLQEAVTNKEDVAFTNIAKAPLSPFRFQPPPPREIKPFPIRTGIAAITLFSIGTILLIVSHQIGLDGENRGLSFFILGLIAFIPGSYASYQLYGSYKGWKGYDYNQIPSYDE